MSTPVILGDWGTTRCRLWLVADGRVRDGAVGAGAKFCEDFPAEFARLTHLWRRAHPGAPALLCGTVGANIGWADAGYIPTPARSANAAAAVHRLDNSEGPPVHILPGVRTKANAFGQPDIMRSEEVQAWGWAQGTGHADARLCLPGSHTKWVELEGGAVTRLTTGFAGELLQTLRAHSILAPAPGEPATGEAFGRGVDVGATHPSLVSALFTPRIGTALGTMDAEEARDHLAGLLVGADCAAMLRAWDGPPDAVVGEGGAARAYRAALSRLGHEVGIADGARTVMAGLAAIAGTLGLVGA